MIYSYKSYVEELIKAAEYFKKVHPDLPDVISTYKESARIIKIISIQLDTAIKELKEYADKYTDCEKCLYDDTREISHVDFIPCGGCGPCYMGGWSWHGCKIEEEIRNEDENS